MCKSQPTQSFFRALSKSSSSFRKSAVCSYKLFETFQVPVDPDSLACKWSKKEKTLTLTINTNYTPQAAQN